MDSTAYRQLLNVTISPAIIKSSSIKLGPCRRLISVNVSNTVPVVRFKINSEAIPVVRFEGTATAVVCIMMQHDGSGQHVQNVGNEPDCTDAESISPKLSPEIGFEPTTCRLGNDRSIH